MKNLYTLLVFTLFSLQNQIGLGQSFEPLNGPSGIYVNLMETAPDGTLYINSAYRNYRSTDSGQTWEMIMDGIPDLAGLFSNLKASPSGDVYLIAGNLFFRLPPGGQTWIAKDLPGLGQISRMSVAPNGGIYVSHQNNGIYYAPTGAASFEKIAQPNFEVRDLRVFGNGQNFLLSNSGGARIHKFSDDGSQIEELFPPILPTEWMHDIDLLSNGTLLLSTNDGIYKSSDDGLSWTYKDLVPNVDFEAVYGIHIQSPGNLFFRTEAGLYFSDDFGETSELIPDFPYDVAPQKLNNARMVFYEQNIYFAVGEERFQHSPDNGQTWNRLDSKLYHPRVTFLKKDFNDNLIVKTSKPEGFEKSADEGQTWEYISMNGTPISQMDFHPNGDWFAVIYKGAEGGSAHRSSDEGQTWTEIIPTDPNNKFFAISILPNGDIWIRDDKDILTSKDLGATWQLTASFEFSPMLPPVAHPNDYLYLGLSEGTYISEDNGETWILFSEEFRHNGAPHIAQNGKIYMPGYGKHPSGIYVAQILVSDENGNNFEPMTNLPIAPQYEYKVLSDCDNNLILMIESELFISEDEGDSWTHIGPDLVGKTGINDIYLDKSYNLYLALDYEVVHKSLGPTCDFVNALGLKDLISKIKISPNPMSDFALIEIDSEENSNYSFRLFDSTGKNILTEKFNSNQHKFQKENLNSGIYFYQIESENQILKTGKLIIK